MSHDNTAAGLIRAGNLLGDNDGNPLVDSDGDGDPTLDFRPDSVWIVVLLSDGAANAALAEGGNPGVLDDWIALRQAARLMLRLGFLDSAGILSLK